MTQPQQSSHQTKLSSQPETQPETQSKRSRYQLQKMVVDDIPEVMVYRKKGSITSLDKRNL